MQKANNTKSPAAKKDKQSPRTRKISTNKHGVRKGAHLEVAGAGGRLQQLGRVQDFRNI